MQINLWVSIQEQEVLLHYARLKCKIAWLCSLETYGVRMMRKTGKLRNRRLWNYLEMRLVVPAG